MMSCWDMVCHEDKKRQKGKCYLREIHFLFLDRNIDENFVLFVVSLFLFKIGSIKEEDFNHEE